jgi:hypothetical protein
VQKLEVFKAADIWKEILVELTILINKGDGWDSLSRLAHNSSPFWEKQLLLPLKFYLI